MTKLVCPFVNKPCIKEKCLAYYEETYTQVDLRRNTSKKCKLIKGIYV